jgi:hypothetical protein
MRNPSILVLEDVLPRDVIVYVLDKYFEYPKKKKTPPVSPSFQREVRKIQLSPKYRTAMYMRGLEDFCLD